MAAFDSSFDSSFDIEEAGGGLPRVAGLCPPGLKPEYTVQTITVTGASTTFDILVEVDCLSGR